MRGHSAGSCVDDRDRRPWLAGAVHPPLWRSRAARPSSCVSPGGARQDRHNRTIKAIELFQKKYPNIKVTYEFRRVA
jgi:hypothetical protein